MMKSSAKGSKPKKAVLAVTILLALVLIAGGGAAAIIWYKTVTAAPELGNDVYLNAACQILYSSIYKGHDTSFPGCEKMDYLPGPEDTEEQRREKADNATIRDALNYYHLNEADYTELLKNCVVREDGAIIPKDRLSEHSNDVTVRRKGTIVTLHREKMVLLDIDLSLDTKLGQLYGEETTIVDRDQSILEEREKTLEQLKKSE